MSYIGRGVDAISNVEKLDNITFNGGTTYALTKSSAAFTPVGANNILISIDGVIQNGNFSVSTTNIVFDFSPTSSNTCNFILHYGTGVLNVPADGSIVAAKMAANSVDSDSYVDGSIDTAHIADDQVTLAKMAGLARGKIIYGDASGNPAALTVGSNTQVLKSDGTDISWGTDSGGAALTGSTNNTVTTVTGANAIQGETNLTYNGTILGAGATGASADLGVGLHIRTADSGASVSAEADELVLENSSDTGMTLLSGTSGLGNIRFGDSGDNNIGRVTYNHSDNSMIFLTNGDERFRVTSDGRGLSQFTAKIWVNLNGSGTIAIRDSHNVSSITDNGTGNYTVTFSNNLGNAEYSTNATSHNGSSTGDFQGVDYMASNAGYVIIQTGYVSGTGSEMSAHDVTTLAAQIFGD
jgi:hypothetical protein